MSCNDEFWVFDLPLLAICIKFLLLEIGIIINKSTWTGLPSFFALSTATTAQQPRNVNLTAKRDWLAFLAKVLTSHTDLAMFYHCQHCVKAPFLP